MGEYRIFIGVGTDGPEVTGNVIKAARHGGRPAAKAMVDRYMLMVGDVTIQRPIEDKGTDWLDGFMQSVQDVPPVDVTP
jgi:ABC-type sugar transport system substrate-binding protein